MGLCDGEKEGRKKNGKSKLFFRLLLCVDTFRPPLNRVKYLLFGGKKGKKKGLNKLYGIFCEWDLFI